MRARMHAQDQSIVTAGIWPVWLAVIVNGLLAQDRQLELLLLRELLEDPRRGTAMGCGSLSVSTWMPLTHATSPV